MPSCLALPATPLSLPPPRVHTLCFTDAGSVQHTPLQKYGVAGEDVHLVGRGCSLSVGQVMICFVSGEFVIFREICKVCQHGYVCSSY